MKEDDDRQVEAWLKTVAPSPVSSSLRARIADDLAGRGRSNRPIKRRIAWALAAACLVLGAFLWWFSSPAPTPAPTNIAEAPTPDHDPILDLPPTAWGYQIALSHSEADLDRLLDFHGERFQPKYRPVTMTSLLE